MKLGNHDLHVVITGGDGDGYGIGIQHFIHSMRRNIDLTYIVMDNEIYGLTTGQASPTTERGEWTKSTPGGCPEDELNPLALAMVAGATYVARGSSAEQEHLTNLIARLCGFKGSIRWDTSRPNGQPRRKLDTHRARERFGFEAKVGFEQGLTETIAWYRTERASMPETK